MGTLTADLPRLAHHCSHKLASSCRLTSTPRCCACADNRGHSYSYAVYVDGVGFVQRGTRWQNYCWFCKTFWDNRVAAASLAPSQTRIPESPDQTEFLARWFEFHQGYRVVKTASGEEQRIAVSGEPFRDVSPGELPRTLEQLRAGALAERVATTPVVSISTESADDTSIDIESALDQLLDEADDDDRHYDLVTPLNPPESLTPQAPLGRPTRPHLPPSTPAATRVMNSTDELRAATAAPQHLQGQSRSQPRPMDPRRAAMFTRVWGTREEFESPDYISPVAGMFNNAWTRHNNLQALRRAQETADPARMREALSNIERDHPAWYATPQAQAALADSLGIRGDGTATQANTEARLAAMERAVEILAQIRGPGTGPATASIVSRSMPSEAQRASRLYRHFAPTQDDDDEDSPDFLGLDGDDRPPPLGEEDLTVKLECKVCLTQRASVACLPCGHLGLCQWCAEQAVPPAKNDRTRPADKYAKCPLCRKRVKSRVQIFIP